MTYRDEEVSRPQNEDRKKKRRHAKREQKKVRTLGGKKVLCRMESIQGRRAFLRKREPGGGGEKLSTKN